MPEDPKCTAAQAVKAIRVRSQALLFEARQLRVERDKLEVRAGAADAMAIDLELLADKLQEGKPV